MERIKVGIAMSGGVDSTSTALLLKEQYTVSGFFMQLAQPDIEDQLQKVREIADTIGIPLHIIDLSHQFEKQVIQYFCKSYLSGLTPNPCMICNHFIKFGIFLETILKTGVDKVATGHYARVVEQQGMYHLLKGIDQRKDQSYFLSRLNQYQLSRMLFPLGSLTKDAIYDFAEDHGFLSFRGEESQDVCFLANESISDFLQRKTQSIHVPGDIIDNSGTVLGRHNGIANYTIGQRKGLGISDISPYYVTALDPDSNNVIVGKSEDLFKMEILISDLHWVSGPPLSLDQEFTVKIRYTHSGSTASLIRAEDSCLRILFKEPQRAVTPGQFAVIYHNDEVLGSGVIS